jgi:HD-GYP domain-containing protein (c-di-GMP phosphodiesterase class II)
MMSIPARMMALADIFEALTVADRPYKKAKPMDESIATMSRMMAPNHIDAELFELFLKSGAYRKYAEKFLLPEQMEEIDVSAYMS